MQPTLETYQVPSATIIRPYGILDKTNAKRVCQAVEHSIAQKLKMIIIDLTNISLIDFFGAEALASIRQQCETFGIELFVGSNQSQTPPSEIPATNSRFKSSSLPQTYKTKFRDK